MRGCPGTPTVQQTGITDYRQEPGVCGVGVEDSKSTQIQLRNRPDDFKGNDLGH